ncbi:MAG TPA: hypothetical protein PLZ25_03945 [Flavobacteriales bacterium]|nr:hypothetical protein [Flavobacteriales bacterium]
MVYTDTVHDQLLAGGVHQIVIDTDQYYVPLYRYNGLAWDTLGLFGNVLKTAVVYHDTLFVAGAFKWMHNDSIWSIACHVDGQWHPYGNFQMNHPFANNGNSNGSIQRLRVVDGELYAMGDFRHADGQLCKGLAKRVGGHWEPLPGWPELNFEGNPRIMDVIRFQGKLVVAGNFNFTGFNPWWKDMLQYDGAAWGPVCDHCLMGGFDNLGSLQVYKDELYIGGRFYYGSGNAGQGIMRWDGETMRSLGPVGGGLQIHNYSDQYPPSIGDLHVRGGLLYISGAFSFVNHLPVATGLCTWDGTDFCLPEGDYFADFFMPIAFYHDTLYGTATGQPNPPTYPGLFGLLRYTGGFTNCTTMGVEEPAGVSTPFHAVWDPTRGVILYGLPDGQHTVRVMDLLGRLAAEATLHSAAGCAEPIRFQPDANAVYVVWVDGHEAVRLTVIQ